MQAYKLLEQDSVLLSQPLLIEQFGRAGAQFLSQLHYWLEHSQCGQQHQGQKWIYNTESSWANQLKLSVRQFRRHVSYLANRGIIFVQKLNPHKSNRTNYFSINYALLDGLLKNNTPSVLDISSETRSFAHEDIMSSSSGQNVPIYNDTKTTNKDFNKSEDLPIEQAEQVKIKKKQVEPVKQVKNSIFKNEEKKEENSDQSPLTEKLADKRPTEKTTTTQDMLSIWNETLGEKAKTSMSKDLAPLLVSAYSKKFEQNLDHWKRYCELIKTSSYLMGDQFQLSIFWGVKYSTIDRIKAGEFGVKQTFTEYGGGQGPKNISVFNDTQVQQMIEALDEPIQAKETRLKIVQAIGSAAYYSWFHQATFVTRDEEIQMIAPNPFVEQAWETQFSWVKKEKMLC
jgi:hypothetical protein